jgi:spore coat polysaccharide biosynthesis protein SpsF
VKHHLDLSSFRWNVDRPQDLEFVRRVYDYLDPNPTFGMEEILRLLRSHPELQMINDGIDPDEGYAKSQREDEVIIQTVGE